MLKARHLLQSDSANNNELQSNTALKISLSGLEVNSSVLGIIILVLSLAFFYLYLVYVYPVKEYNMDKAISIEQPGIKN